jgi:glycosyltransferase involved in cell wall biosynthesis
MPKGRDQRRRLRVLTLVDNPDITGGGERMAVTIAMRLDPGRFDRALCATRSVDGPNFDRELREAGVTTFSLDRRSRHALSAWRPLISFLRRQQIDIVHAHKFGSNVWGTLLGRLSGVPIVIAHEQSWASARYSAGGPRLRSFLDREVVARHADVFFAVSQADRRRMIDLEGVPAERVRVLPNAIPAPIPTGHDVRRELAIPPTAPVVGTVCQLRPEKGLDLLVTAASELVPRYPELRILIAGDGVEEGALRALVGRYGLGANVLLLGTRTDIPDVVAAFDIGVCCSHFEGTPLSVMEYMAAGKPVVASDVGGLPELIQHGVHGLLVEPGSPPALADALANLLDEPQRRATLGSQAQERQTREFDLDHAVRRIENLYEELFRASPRGRQEGWAPAAVVLAT